MAGFIMRGEFGQFSDFESNGSEDKIQEIQRWRQQRPLYIAKDVDPGQAAVCGVEMGANHVQYTTQANMMHAGSVRGVCARDLHVGIRRCYACDQF